MMIRSDISFILFSIVAAIELAEGSLKAATLGHSNSVGRDFVAQR